MNAIVDTIRNVLPSKRKRTSAGWESFNCPACTLMGEPRLDTRQRGGIIFTSTGGVSYHCFNCKIKAHWEPGSLFSKKFEILLKSFGLTQVEFQRLKFKAWQMRGQVAQNTNITYVPKVAEITFKEVDLPIDAKSFDEWAATETPPNGFLRAAEYINIRSESFLKAYTYYWTPSLKRSMNRRVIVPFYWNNLIVGYTARLFAGTPSSDTPRYLSQMQENYLFNNKALFYKDRLYAILVEGVFDAIAVDGVGLLGNTLTKQQIDWINTSELDIVLVPQRDSGTEELISIAINQGWSVSFPDTMWEEDINDVAAAASRYGRIYTLRSIIDNIIVDKNVIKNKFDMLRFNRKAYNKNEVVCMAVYSEAEQELLVIFLLSSNELFVRSRNIIKDSYFDKKFQKSVKFILEYADEQARLPSRQQVVAHAGLDFDLLTPEEAKHQERWFLEHIELFCRHKAMEQAIEASVEQISKGNYAAVQDMTRDALLISLTKDLGLDLFKDPGSFIEELKNKNSIKSTGWKSVDEKLYGGFNPGELNIFAGAPGTGKSLFLQNLALNWVQMGLDVIYLSLELSEELAGMRMNAMITGKSTKEVFRDSEELAKTIKTLHNIKRWGDLTIKYMPIGTTAHNIKSYLKEYEIQKNKKPDCILIDYLDLLHPNSRKIDASNLFVKDKYVSEELRSLMKECNLLGATASQLNREAMEEKDHEMYHIAGGISKINTADNVLTIYTSQTLKDSGQIRLQFIKTRSSAGVGQRVFLAFDQSCMRITDADADDDTSSPKKDMSEIGEKFKRKSKIQSEASDIKPVNESDSNATDTGSGNAATGAALRTFLQKTKALNDG